MKKRYKNTIEDSYFVNYVNKTVSKVIPEIKKNIAINKLKNTFITLNNSKENFIRYEDKESINNSKFKIITEEIRECSKVEDKIKVIKNEIHSLKDLVDVLGADCIFNEEFIDIFRTLDDFEISLLLKYMSNNLRMDVDYGTESEKDWKEKLRDYLDSLEQVKKRKIIQISHKIDIQIL